MRKIPFKVKLDNDREVLIFGEYFTTVEGYHLLKHKQLSQRFDRFGQPAFLDDYFALTEYGTGRRVVEGAHSELQHKLNEILSKYSISEAASKFETINTEHAEDLARRTKKKSPKAAKLTDPIEKKIVELLTAMQKSCKGIAVRFAEDTRTFEGGHWSKIDGLTGDDTGEERFRKKYNRQYGQYCKITHSAGEYNIYFDKPIDNILQFCLSKNIPLIAL